MDIQKYKVRWGRETTVLNWRLVERMGVSDEVLELIKDTHRIRMCIFKNARNTDCVETLRTLAQEFDELEFVQQELWGFGRDSTYHNWFEFPKCTCPKMDNADMRGTTYRIITADCPIHGQL